MYRIGDKVRIKQMPLPYKDRKQEIGKIIKIYRDYWNPYEVEVKGYHRPFMFKEKEIELIKKGAE